MSAISIVVSVVVMSWLILTVIAQFRSISARISRFDIFRLIPIWTFFAPNPGVVDYHLVIRDRRRDGSLSNWAGINIASERHSTNIFWNPQKRPKKIILDVVQSLIIITAAQRESMGQEIISLPYLMLLHIAISMPRMNQDSVGRQFAVIQTSGHTQKDLQLAYLSQFHRILVE